jgi:hypothetical protein
MKIELPDLDLLRLDFRLRAEDSVALPPFLGSTIRGALGAALKQVFCFVPHETTENCWFAEACPYQYIFESKNLGHIPAGELHPFLKGQKEFPHPFVLLPPAPFKKRCAAGGADLRRFKNLNEDYQSNHFSRGEALDFSLLLIGKATRHWPHVLVAVRLLAHNGLGEQAARVPFSLVKAFAHDTRGKSVEVFSEMSRRVSVGGVAPVKLPQIVNLQTSAGSENFQIAEGDHLQIEFITPVARRVLLDGKTAGQLDFTSLIKKIAERIEILASLHAEPSQKIDYRPILNDAKEICVSQNSLQYYHYEQKSGRQQRVVRRDVFLGKISYHGEKLNEYFPLLKAGEILNVGADTTHGCGRFIFDL